MKTPGNISLKGEGLSSDGAREMGRGPRIEEGMHSNATTMLRVMSRDGTRIIHTCANKGEIKKRKNRILKSLHSDSLNFSRGMK
jgi:hypothetical protein